MSSRHLRFSVVCALIGLTVGCGAEPAPTPPPVSTSSVPTAASSPTRQVSPTSRAAPTATSRLTPAGPERTEPQEPKPPGLVGDRRNAFAFAPLDDPGAVTVEGRVSASPAWSTSKVLVVAAFLDTAAGGDPERVSAANRRRITAALTRSDPDAVLSLRRQIVGRPGSAMTAVLRDIGDKTTVAPDRYEGEMTWTVREQVRFMAALGNGRVVSRRASRYLLDTMQPIESHAWGLGTVGATAYKGGWLRRDTVTRQLGIVDGYAVAIITDGVGPAVRQSDGDSAHVQQLNRLARLLERRLAYEEARR